MKSGGFSLVEVLLAFAVSAALMASSSRVLGQYQRWHRHIQTRRLAFDRALENIERARLNLPQTFDSAVPLTVIELAGGWRELRSGKLVTWVRQ